MRARRTVWLVVLTLVVSPGLVLASGAGPVTASAATATKGSDPGPNSVAAPTGAPKGKPDPRPNSAPLSSTKTRAGAVVLTVEAPSPTTYGDTVHLVATVDLTKVAAGGTMAFTDNGVVIGFGPLDGSGAAEVSTATLTAGRHALVATYAAGGTTTSASSSLTVAKRALHLYAHASSWSRPVGAANPTLSTAVVDGNLGDLVNGDTLETAVSGNARYSLKAGATSPPSVYPIGLSGLKSTNYSLVFQKAGLTVYTRDIAVGSEAPELTGPDQNGDSFSLSSLRGKAVLLDFSAVWCGPSNDLARNIPKVVSDLHSQGIDFAYVPVLIDGPTPGVGATQVNAHNYFVKYKLPGQTHVLHMNGVSAALGAPLPVPVDQIYGYGAVPTADNGGVAYPTLAFIDPEGVIQNVVIGNLGPEAIEDELTAIAPDTGVQIVSVPPGVKGDGNATIEFTTTDDAQAQCKLDGGSFANCDSPYVLTDLAEGPHSVEITIGYPYSTTISWTVIPIDSQITGGPGDTYVPTFEFTGTGAVESFECWSDDEDPYECGSPSGVFQMPEGAHTFYVAAIGPNGLRDDTPATMAFTTQPLPTFVVTPDIPNPGPSDQVTWTVTVTDAVTSDPVTGSVQFNGPNGSSTEIVLVNGSASYTEPFTATNYTEYISYFGDPLHGAGFTSASVPVP